jgi:hypothetical protein
VGLLTLGDREDPLFGLQLLLLVREKTTMFSEKLSFVVDLSSFMLNGKPS